MRSKACRGKEQSMPRRRIPQHSGIVPTTCHGGRKAASPCLIVCPSAPPDDRSACQIYCAGDVFAVHAARSNGGPQRRPPAGQRQRGRSVETREAAQRSPDTQRDRRPALRETIRRRNPATSPCGGGLMSSARCRCLAATLAPSLRQPPTTWRSPGRSFAHGLFTSLNDVVTWHRSHERPSEPR
jgi:hypothetical protein